MGYHNSPSKGQPVKFSASRERDINEMLNRFGMGPETVSKGGQSVHGWSISGYPSVDTGFYCPVQIDTAGDDSNIVSGNGIFPIKVAPSGATDFGIAIYPIAALGVGRVVMAGIVPMPVDISSESHTSVVVGANGNLLSAASGNCKILWREAATGTDVWCMVQLGFQVAAAAAPVAYTGPFAVTVSGTTYTIAAGTVTVNGVPYSVGAGTLTSSGTLVYLVATLNGTTGVMSFSFADTYTPASYGIGSLRGAVLLYDKGRPDGFRQVVRNDVVDIPIYWEAS